MPGAVFSPIAERMREVPGGVCPLHVGDTWMPPFAGGRMEDLREAEHAGMHGYVETRGLPALVDAIVEKIRARNAFPCERGGVLVTAGATGGLHAALGAISSPGEEVLILAPYWPLIPGVVQALRATPVPVPFFGAVASASDAVEAVASRLTPRTAALYVSTPSNPTGRVIPPDWLETLAEWASREGLWILSDEVYEDYVYRGTHASTGRFAPERTLSVYSFSKAYGMAGNRVGYVVGPAPAVTQALKIGTHSFYHAPTSGQLAALRALRDGEDWVEAARQGYRAIGDETAARLAAPPPEGATYHFLDVRDALDERGIWGFLEDCVSDGVALAPGPSCGPGYDTYVRLCYTAAPPDAVREAVRSVAARMGR
jgi:N-succinyldiaminopimelate aminotransferase